MEYYANFPNNSTLLWCGMAIALVGLAVVSLMMRFPHRLKASVYNARDRIYSTLWLPGMLLSLLLKISLYAHF